MIALALALLAQEPAATLSSCGAHRGSFVRSESALSPAIDEERSTDVGAPLLVSTDYDVLTNVHTLAVAATVTGTTSRAPFTLTMPAGTVMSFEPQGYRPASFSFEGRGPRPTDVLIEGAGTSNPVARLSWGFIKERHPVSAGTFSLAHSECIYVRPTTLTRQLAFTGVSRGVVSLEYREFSGDMARPAFTQAATYDLAEGRIIGFRGSRIEVLSADNVGIRYRVIKGFD